LTRKGNLDKERCKLSGRRESEGGKKGDSQITDNTYKEKWVVHGFVLNLHILE
jgi:hypothetical protein